MVLTLCDQQRCRVCRAGGKDGRYRVPSTVDLRECRRAKWPPPTGWKNALQSWASLLECFSPAYSAMSTVDTCNHVTNDHKRLIVTLSLHPLYPNYLPSTSSAYSYYEGNFFFTLFWQKVHFLLGNVWIYQNLGLKGQKLCQ